MATHNKIFVEPSRVKDSAKQISSLAAEYQQLYRQLLDAVTQMRTSWTGADNVAFTDQVLGIEADYQSMYQYLENLSGAMTTSAANYESTQGSAVSGARTLKN